MVDGCGSLAVLRSGVMGRGVCRERGAVPGHAGAATAGGRKRVACVGSRHIEVAAHQLHIGSRIMGQGRQVDEDGAAGLLVELRMDVH